MWVQIIAPPLGSYTALAAYLALILQMRSVFIFIRGMLIVPTSQGCPAHQMSHHTDSTYSQLLWFVVNTQHVVSAGTSIHVIQPALSLLALSPGPLPRGLGSHSTFLPYRTASPWALVCVLWRGHCTLGPVGDKLSGLSSIKTHLTCLSLSITLLGRCYFYHPYFAVEETKAQRAMPVSNRT